MLAKGEGLGNQFLANIREVDAIVHVVRCFEDEQYYSCRRICRSDASDVETINLELIFSDIEMSGQKNCQNHPNQAKEWTRQHAKELEASGTGCQGTSGRWQDWLRTFDNSEDDEDDQIWFKNYQSSDC